MKVFILIPAFKVVPPSQLKIFCNEFISEKRRDKLLLLIGRIWTIMKLVEKCQKHDKLKML